MDSFYENLANAIIAQAATDYRANANRRALLASRLEKAEQSLTEANLTNDKTIIDRAKDRLERVKDSLFALDVDQDGIERFFRSQWFQFLTDADGEVILQQLQAEARK